MTPEWIEDLGLVDVDPEEPDRRRTLVASEVGLAFSPVPSLRAPDTRAANLERVLHTAPFLLPELGPPQVVGFAGDPEIVLVAMTGAKREAQTGEVQETHPGEWVLDGRAGPAGLLLADAGSRCAVVVVEGEARVFDLGILEPPPVEPELALPDIEAWLTDLESWLVERLRPMFDSGAFFPSIVGLGTLARMWSPVDTTAAVRRLMAGDRHPPGQIAIWADSLKTAEWDELLRDARADIGVCHELLDEIRSAAVEERHTSGQQALRSLVERRDGLASVHWVLSKGKGRLPELDGALQELDERAVMSWSERPSPTGLEKVRWVHEVGNREPEAWWGQP